MKTALGLAVLGLLVSPQASARFLRAPRFENSRGNLSLRKRLNVNTLITQPGTSDIDWSCLHSFTSASYSLPAAIKYAPEGKYLLWGRTEYSVSFDSITNAQIGGGRLTQFSQALTATATTVVF